MPLKSMFGSLYRETLLVNRHADRRHGQPALDVLAEALKVVEA